MTFVKYQVKDNSFGQLLAGISAVTTSIVLKTGNGANLPTITSPNNPSVLTLVQVDGTGAIVKSEQVLCTNRTSDTITVTRGFAGTTAQAFDADDYIYLYQTATVTQDMQNEIERLEDEKLDTSTFHSTLRNNLGNWKIIYTNASGDETELPLGSSGQYLRSTGVNTAPEFAAPPLDINGQTTDNGALAVNDYLVYYDTSEGANNKRVAKASTTVEGLSKFMSETTFRAGKSQEESVNLAFLAKYLFPIAGIGTTTQVVSIPGSFGVTTGIARICGADIYVGGRYTYQFTYTGFDVSQQFLQIRLNGSTVASTTLSVGGDATTVYTINMNIDCVSGDDIELWTSGGGNLTGNISSVSIRCTPIQNTVGWTAGYFTGTVV